MKRTCAVLTLALLTLSACDSGNSEPKGDLYILRLLGTAGLTATCTISLNTDRGVQDIGFQGLVVPDEANLGVVLGVSAFCTKEQQDGELRLELLAEGLIVSMGETTENFGSVSVGHP